MTSTGITKTMTKAEVRRAVAALAGAGVQDICLVYLPAEDPERLHGVLVVDGEIGMTYALDQGTALEMNRDYGPAVDVGAHDLGPDLRVVPDEVDGETGKDAQ